MRWYQGVIRFTTRSKSPPLQIEVVPETGLEEWAGVMGWHFDGKG